MKQQIQQPWRPATKAYSALSSPAHCSWAAGHPAGRGVPQEAWGVRASGMQGAVTL